MSKASLNKFIEIRFSDPICAIELKDKELLYGSMLGRSGYYNIENDKHLLLSEIENERISGLQFSDTIKGEFYVSLGDVEIRKYNKKEDNKISKMDVEKNYENPTKHIENCQKCFPMLYKTKFLRIYMNLPPGHKDQDYSSFENKLGSINYDLKDIITPNSISGGIINMSSYAVPFDFDGNKLLWVDFITEYERYIFIYNFNEKKNDFELKLNPSFGHISHFYFLPNNQLFLIRNSNQCEIRNSKFEIIKSFYHIGEECIASHYYFDEINQILYIVTLDIDGNINIFNTKSNNITCRR